MTTLDDVAHRYALTDDEKTAVAELHRVLPCDFDLAAQLIRHLGRAAQTTAQSLRDLAAPRIEIYPQTIRRCAELTGVTR